MKPLPHIGSSVLMAATVVLVQPETGGSQHPSSPPPPSLIVTPSSGVVFSGPEGGPFAPLSVRYHVRASAGRVNYSIREPAWLTTSANVGSVDTVGITITLTINHQAYHLQPGAYGPAVAFTNVTNGKGSVVRRAILLIHARSTASVERLQDNRVLLDDERRMLLDNMGRGLLAR